MSIDYKKELESAAKNMILVHDPDILISMIVRMISQKVKITHAGILLKDPQRESYVLTVSRGQKGLKIPKGYARMDSDNALIRFFKQPRQKGIVEQPALIYAQAKKISAKEDLAEGLSQLLKKALYQMEIFGAQVCIPSYFREDLLGILFLGKKKNNQEFNPEELDFFAALASDVAMAIRNAQLFKELELEINKEHRLFIHTTVALAAAIDAKDHYTHGHTARVTNISLEISRCLIEKNKDSFSGKFLEDLHVAALLHDIGKIGIPESILNKEGALTPQEQKYMEGHPEVGVNILQPIKELENSILGVKYHHEKYDGSGYPEGLKGEEIPLIAAIISVADAFDAMTTDRPYRIALSRGLALEEISRQSGKQFHPGIVEALKDICLEGKI